jgi:hypothetical protein
LVAVAEAVSVGVADGPSVFVAVAVAVSSGVAVAVGGTGVFVAVGVSVDGSSVAVGVSVDGSSVAVADAVTVGVSVAGAVVAVAVAVAVGVFVAGADVFVAVAVADAVLVAVAAPVQVTLRTSGPAPGSVNAESVESVTDVSDLLCTTVMDPLPAQLKSFSKNLPVYVDDGTLKRAHVPTINVPLPIPAAAGNVHGGQYVSMSGLSFDETPV